MRNSAAGPDNIPMIFLKQLHLASLAKVLELYNQIWTTHQFPTLWRQSHIIPIKKAGSASPSPSSYRPISLTCTLCRLLEKMVNRRLMWFLEVNNLLSPTQSAFRQNRCTTDNLVLFQTEIAYAFAHKQDLIAVMLDIESAFDTTSRESILAKLKNINLNGNIYLFLKNFLTDRSFKVLANGEESVSFFPQNGICQGSVLSTTLFLLVINDICSCIEAPLKLVLYADDILLFYSGSNTDTTCKIMQEGLNNITEWAERIGFQFSASKSKLIRFTRRYPKGQPLLILNGSPLPQVDSIKLLGMTFDQRLTWTQHIKNVKGSCLHTMNILRTLSHHQWGCDEDVLLKIYRSLIRPKLDYGCILYSTSSKTNLKILNTVPNTAIRIALGAFRSTPSESLHVEAREFPLNNRRLQFLLSYSTKVSASPNHPVSHLINEAKNPDRIYPRTLLSIPQLVLQNIGSLDLSKTIPMSFSKQAPWTRRRININTSLQRYKKHITPEILLKNSFLELVNNEAFDQEIYTDASKDDNSVACSVVDNLGAPKTFKIPPICSIHTGELYAIYKSLFTPITSGSKVGILTDSLSSIQSITNIFSKNPLVQKIQEKCHNIMEDRNASITIVWTPSHVGILGNDQADTAANLARTSDSPVIDMQLHTDLRNKIKLEALHAWQAQWDATDQKLHAIQPMVHDPIKLDMKRQDKIVARRLRMGHTKLTHGFLMSSGDAPNCEHCPDERLTVKHLITLCPYYGDARRRYGIKEHLHDVLSSPTQIEATIRFLKDNELYSII